MTTPQRAAAPAGTVGAVVGSPLTCHHCGQADGTVMHCLGWLHPFHPSREMCIAALKAVLAEESQHFASFIQFTRMMEGRLLAAEGERDCARSALIDCMMRLPTGGPGAPGPATFAEWRLAAGLEIDPANALREGRETA